MDIDELTMYRSVWRAASARVSYAIPAPIRRYLERVRVVRSVLDAQQHGDTEEVEDAFDDLIRHLEALREEGLFDSPATVSMPTDTERWALIADLVERARQFGDSDERASSPRWSQVRAGAASGGRATGGPRSSGAGAWPGLSDDTADKKGSADAARGRGRGGVGRGET